MVSKLIAAADGEKVEDKSCENRKALRAEYQARKAPSAWAATQTSLDCLFWFTALISSLVEEKFSSSSRNAAKQEARLEKMEAKVAKHQRKSQKRQQRVRALMAADMELTDRQDNNSAP